ncbi:hypothetical protein [Variovorax sp. PAMC 28711]|nr:hypothetical protein [Variovorax sp. PAMC 28711]
MASPAPGVRDAAQGVALRAPTAWSPAREEALTRLPNRRSFEERNRLSVA